jgi:hypothetical protein
MTQVKEWSNPELNRALAELMGYRIEKAGSFWLLHKDGYFTGSVHYEEEKAYEMLPDYCTDPAASLEVQTAAIAKYDKRYVVELDRIVNPDDQQHEWEESEIAKLLTASPRERAEAVYITLQGQ